MHSHSEEDHERITHILLQIAAEENKSLERIKHLLFVKQNGAIRRKFWNLINTKMPEYSHRDILCCSDCGTLTIDEELQW